MTTDNMGTIFAPGWEHPDTRSGPGSSWRAIYAIREQLFSTLWWLKPQGRDLLVNDVGCGDVSWIGEVLPDGTDYQGYDVTEWETWPELREAGWKLCVSDPMNTEMRSADVIICRDVMIHYPNDMCLNLIERCRHSSDLLIATSYTSGTYGTHDRTFSNENRQRRPGRSFRRLDLSQPPFSLKCLARIPEAHEGKYLGVWYLPRS